MKKNLLLTLGLSLLFAVSSCGECKHDWDEGVITKEATEEEKGTKTYTCSKCEETKVEDIDKLTHTHKYSTSWKSDVEYHWHNAICDHDNEIKDKAKHTWDAGKVDIEATYTEEGRMVYTCTVCNHQKSETIPVIAHTHTSNNQYQIDEEYHWYTCSTCNEVIDKAKHSGGEATCVEKAKCEVCGEHYGEKIPHNMSEDVFVSNDTSHWNECENENCDHKSDVVGHVYSQEVTEEKYLQSEATCTAAKTYYKSCVCGQKGTTTFTVGEPLGHIGGKATCQTLAECDRCHNIYGEFADHDYGRLVEKVEPTCEEEGTKAYYHCLECLGYFTENKQQVKYVDLIIAAKGHYLMPHENETQTWYECEREGCDYVVGIKDKETNTPEE